MMSSQSRGAIVARRATVLIGFALGLNTSTQGQPLFLQRVDPGNNNPFFRVSGPTIVGSRSGLSPSGRVDVNDAVSTTPFSWTGTGIDLTLDPGISLPPNAAFGSGFDIDGDTMVVGAPIDEAGGLDSGGAVYIFGRNVGGADNWGLVTRLEEPTPVEDGAFGMSVAVDDAQGYLVVGAPNSGSNIGLVYVYERDSALGWQSPQQLSPPPFTLGTSVYQPNSFGQQVDLDGIRILVGAPDTHRFIYNEFGIPTSNTEVGAVVAFERGAGGGSVWAQTDIFTDPDLLTNPLTLPGQDFGFTLALSGEWAIIRHNGNAGFYQRQSGGQWDHVKSVDVNQGVGVGVAIEGELAIIRRLDSMTGLVAELYARSAGMTPWGVVGEFVPDGDPAPAAFAFKSSVDINSSLAVFSTGEQGQVFSIDGIPRCLGDADGDGVVDFGDVTAALGNSGNDYTPFTGPGDANLDGVVVFNDVTTVLGNWLNVCPGSDATASSSSMSVQQAESMLQHIMLGQ